MCVQSGEIVAHTDIAIAGHRIAYVGEDARHAIGPDTVVIEAKGRFLVPGLLDGHMHVESGMLTVTEFVRAVIPHGTTGMFIDPHEIANVLGLARRAAHGGRGGAPAHPRLCPGSQLRAFGPGAGDGGGGDRAGRRGGSAHVAGHHRARER